MTPTGQGVTVSEHDPALDLDALTRGVIGEGEGEPVEGQKAIAHVVLNRAQAAGQSVAKIVSEPNQFQGYSTPRAQNISPSNPTYQRVLQAVTPVYYGQEEDPTGGATNFIAPKLQAAEGGRMPAIKNGVPIGNHVFYSGGWKPENAEPPSVAELLNQAAAGMNSTNATAPAPQTAEAAGPPSVEELIAQLPPDQRPAQPKSNAPPQTAQTAAQQAARQAVGSDARPANALDVFENSVLGNLRPTLDAGITAGVTGAQNALANVGIGKKLPFGMGDAYDAVRSSEQGALDAYQGSHPVTGTLANLAGFVAPGGVVEGAGRLGASALEHVAPGMVSSAVGRLGLHTAGNAAGGAVAGAGAGVSQGQDAASIAGDAALGGASAGVLTPLGAGASKLAGNAGKLAPLVAPAVGAGIGALGGAGVAAATGQPLGQGAKTGAELLGLASLRFPQGKSAQAPDALPTGKDTRSVLERLQGVLPSADTLARAHPSALTAEALGPAAPKLIKEAVANGGTASDDMASAVEARKAGSGDRIVQALKAAGAPDASTAGGDIEAATDAARKGPGKAAYTAAITGKGVYSPEIRALLSTGPVRKAVSRAYDTLRERGVVPNPKLPQPGESVPQERMTATEFKARAAEAAGKPHGGDVTNEDILNFVRTAKPDTFQLAPKEPSTIPTDEALDLAKKHLDKMAASNGPDQYHYQEAAKAFTAALKSADGIGPAYAHALATAGDYLSNKEAAEKGEALWSRGKTSEDGATFAKRVAKETPAQRQFGLQGYLKGLYNRVENNKFNPNEILQSPFHQRVLETYLGNEGASKITDALKLEQGFEQNHGKLLNAAKPVAPAMPAEDPGLLGAILVGAEHGFHPMAMVKGYFTGKAASSAKDAIQAALNRPMTNGERNALGKILAQPAQVTAKMLNEHQAMKGRVNLGQSLFRDLLERTKNTLPSAVTATAGNALHGVTTDRKSVSTALPQR